VLSKGKENPFRVDEVRIGKDLEEAKCGSLSHAFEIIEKAENLEGLSNKEIALLAEKDSLEINAALAATAGKIKKAIYGNRMLLFAPLYLSNHCINDCLYCAFRVSNRQLKRVSLSQEQIAEEVRSLIGEGHKRILLVAGEEYATAKTIEGLFESINTIYSTRSKTGEIRRININVAPLEPDHFVQLKTCGIGTYQLFQETYQRATYVEMHPSGPKSDYENHLGAMERAMAAGIGDVGLGVLFGLASWKFEILAMMQHIRHMENTFGVGPHTISVPRIEPAPGASAIASSPPDPVSNHDFLRMIAILRLAVPYTGIIMSTRESAAMRKATYSLGVSQISASSRTHPGGYSNSSSSESGAQFQLGDHRSLDQVIAELLTEEYLPSFCTACYRSGRVGKEFMNLAKPGDIKEYCRPNAIMTLQEYLSDHGSPETRKRGKELIEKTLTEMPAPARKALTCRMERIRKGERDIFF
jgi:2-iminoacetate synthase